MLSDTGRDLLVAGWILIAVAAVIVHAKRIIRGIDALAIAAAFMVWFGIMEFFYGTPEIGCYFLIISAILWAGSVVRNAVDKLREALKPGESGKSK